MLDDVVERYLKGLTERDFDAPFEALLRLRDFSKIHCLHGAFEFGKDFIAQRRDAGGLVQYAIQSKAGDVDGSDWRGLRGQLDDLIHNDIAHPNFDASLPRQPVLVLTGRLRGGAPANAQQYADSLVRRGFRRLEVWDVSTLVELLAHDARAALRGSLELELEELVIQARTGRATEAAVRRFSERWTVGEVRPEEVWRNCLQASIICDSLVAAGRLDLAACLPLLLARQLWRRTGCLENGGEGLLAGIDLAHRLFRHYARALWQEAQAADLDPAAVGAARRDEMFFVGYLVWCSRVMEIIGLLALDEKTTDSERAAMREFLVALIEKNPGCGHPLSDHWAVSLLLACLFLGRSDPGLSQSLLTAVTKWTCDAYEGGLGLAPANTGPKAEVETLLGAPFEHVGVGPRRTSYIAAVVLDLCAVFEWSETYDVVINEFLACKVYPMVVEPETSDDTCSFLGAGGIAEMNMHYEEAWPASGDWRVAPHHLRVGACFFSARGDDWSGIAMSVAMRDRHLLCCVRALSQVTLAVA